MVKTTKSTKRLIEASKAVAEAVKLARVKLIAAYPITPQTHIMENIAQFIADGKLKAELMDVESEHSAISACVGAQATGIRTFTATASQGLALMHEVMYIASGLRLPVVMVVANRTLSAPINIWCDHQDTMGERDNGWLQFYAETSQEAFDFTLIAYKISENHKVLLPSIVAMDGYTLTHLNEIIDIPKQKTVDRFLPDYKPYYKLDPKEPISVGPIGFPNSFMEFRKQQQEAMTKAKQELKKVFKEFENIFSRRYSFIETYNIKNTKKLVIAMGSVCGTIKHYIDNFDKELGLIKISVFRPFPSKELRNALKPFKQIGIIDRAISPGQTAPLFTEIKSHIEKDKKNKEEKNIKSFIAGLGGRDVNLNHIKKLSKELEKTKEKDKEVWLL